MKKSVLLSIKPEFCALIASGEKTVEIRKTRPKIDVPFKCCVYCTKGNVSYFTPTHTLEKGNGKVIGEFVCDYMDMYAYSERGYYIPEAQTRTCLTDEEIERYGGGNHLYGWHISDLVIYDTPKELSEFYRKCNGIHCRGNDCEHWKHVRANADEFDMDCDCNELPPITRPPQSWCYVEELKG